LPSMQRRSPFFIFTSAYASRSTNAQDVSCPENSRIRKIVWLNEGRGPGGGGGGGGNKMPEPPAGQPSSPERTKLTVPVLKPPGARAERKRRRSQNPVEQFEHPGPKTLASANRVAGRGCSRLPPAPPTTSQGSGIGGGAGHRSRQRDRTGQWFRTWPGQRRRHRGGVYQPGNGVTLPTRTARGEAAIHLGCMRAKDSGHGASSHAFVRPRRLRGVTSTSVRSLIRWFGLDEEGGQGSPGRGVFAPGTRNGRSRFRCRSPSS